MLCLPVLLFLISCIVLFIATLHPMTTWFCIFGWLLGAWIRKNLPNASSSFGN